MVLLFYTTYISVDLAHQEIFHAKVGKGGIGYKTDYQSAWAWALSLLFQKSVWMHINLKEMNHRATCIQILDSWGLGRDLNFIFVQKVVILYINFKGLKNRTTQEQTIYLAHIFIPWERNQGSKMYLSHL